MRTDVQTLIAALTTERNSIDRAIASLKQMSDSGEPKTKASAPRPRKQRRQTILPEAKAEIVTRMEGSNNKFFTAKTLGHEYGLKAQTIYTSWNKWKDAASNGNMPAPDPVMTSAVQ